jgi:hypothetical protein
MKTISEPPLTATQVAQLLQALTPRMPDREIARRDAPAAESASRRAQRAN